MSLNTEDRRNIVIYRLEKSLAAYEDATLNIGIKRWNVVANRLYYAAYYAVSSLLIANGYFTKTHEGVIMEFGLHFAKEGKVSKELARLYSKLYDLRITGDYNDHFNIEESDVLPFVEPAKELIDTVSSMAKNILGIDN